MEKKKTVLIILSFLLVNLVIESECKRTFSIRTRSKSNSGRQYSSRRKSHDYGQYESGAGSSGSGLTNGQGVGGTVERTQRQAVPISHGQPSAPAYDTAVNKRIDLSPQTDTKPIGWNTGNNNNKPLLHDPPPPYPGLSNIGSANRNLPPPYSMHEPPPSYNSHNFGNTYYSNGYGYPQSGSNIQRIPPRGQSNNHGLDTTSFHGLGGNGYNLYGGPINNGGYHNGGLYNNFQPNNGLNNGFNGLVGNYGQGYGYGHKSSSPFSFGNVLTGLALWNVARGYNSYPPQQHIHIHDHSDSKLTNTESSIQNFNMNNADNLGNNPPPSTITPFNPTISTSQSTTITSTVSPKLNDKLTKTNR